MSTSIRNIHNICRFCLTELDYENNEDAQKIFNIYRNQQLFKLMVLFPTLDISNETCDECPKNLCKICHRKCMDFDNLRKDVLRSTMTLLNLFENKEFVEAEEPKSYIEESTLTSDHPAEQKTNKQGFTSRKRKTRHVPTQEIMPKEQNGIVENFSPLETLLVQYGDSNNLDPQNVNFNDFTSIKNEVNCDESEFQYIYQISQIDEPKATTYKNSNQHLPSVTETSPNSLSMNGKSNQLFKNRKELSVKVQVPKSDIEDKVAVQVFRCPLCGRQKKNAVYLEAHIRGVHQGHAQPFQCKYCHQAFTRYFRLDEHVKKQHTKEKGKHNCTNCGGNFISKWDLRRHCRVYPACWSHYSQM